MIIAASMAELASAYPTAGGLYFWAHRLGGTRWAWVTAWFNMIGQITITSGINIAAAIYIVGALSKITGHTFSTNWYFYVFVMVLIMIPADADQHLRHPVDRPAERLLACGGTSSAWRSLRFFLTVLGKTHHDMHFAMSFVNTTNPYDFSSAMFPTAPRRRRCTSATRSPRSHWS